MTNREIKFRAWDGKVMHVDLYEVEWLTDGSYNINEDVRIAQNGLMQYTGLKDKNGREIYEGDKLAHPSMQNPMVVVWHERTAGFGLNAAGWAYTHFFYEAVDPVECEVVGNIHEIPELIPA